MRISLCATKRMYGNDRDAFPVPEDFRCCTAKKVFINKVIQDACFMDLSKQFVRIQRPTPGVRSCANYEATYDIFLAIIILSCRFRCFSLISKPQANVKYSKYLQSGNLDPE